MRESKVCVFSKFSKNRNLLSLVLLGMSWVVRFCWGFHVYALVRKEQKDGGGGGCREDGWE